MLHQWPGCVWLLVMAVCAPTVPPPLHFFFFLFIYLFLAVLCLHCCARALSSWQQVVSALHCSAQACHCGGFSCWVPLDHTDFPVIYPNSVNSGHVTRRIFPKQGLNLCSLIIRQILKHWTTMKGGPLNLLLSPHQEGKDSIFQNFQRTQG